MNRTPALAALALAGALIFTGCTPTPQTGDPTPSEAVQQPAMTAADITTIDQGIEWARGLDGSVTATELSKGIIRIGEFVPDLDIWFQTSNELSQNLISLNADVLANQDDAGSKVDDLNDIMDDLEAAISKGNKP